MNVRLADPLSRTALVRPNFATESTTTVRFNNEPGHSTLVFELQEIWNQMTGALLDTIETINIRNARSLKDLPLDLRQELEGWDSLSDEALFNFESDLDA